jgi:cytolysin-activating lysine-acyltransferase
MQPGHQILESTSAAVVVVQDLDSQLSRRLQERQKLLGAVTWLMMNSPLHMHYRVKEISERILPSILHNQFRIYEKDGRPIGFMNWALLCDEVEAKYQTGRHELDFLEWNSGQNLWFHEFIAPFGHTKYIVRDLRQNIFPTHEGDGKALRVTSEGKVRGIIRYKQWSDPAQSQ